MTPEKVQKIKNIDNNLKVGDKVRRYVAAPWDEDVPVGAVGTIVLQEGKKFFKGDNTNEYDDFLTNIRKNRRNG